MKGLPRNNCTFLPRELVDDSHKMSQDAISLFLVLCCVCIRVIRIILIYYYVGAEYFSEMSQVLVVRCTPDVKNLVAPISIKGKDTSGIWFCLELSGTSGIKGVGKSCIWNISCSHFYVTGNGVNIIALGQVTA